MSNYYYSQQGYGPPSGYPGASQDYYQSGPSSQGHGRPPSYQPAADDSVEYLHTDDPDASAPQGFDYVYPASKQQQQQQQHARDNTNMSQHLTVGGGGAGVGAGSNAYRRPSEFDSPSVYTDPYDWQSSAGHTNAHTVTPNPQAPGEYLEQDPYDPQTPRGHAAQGSQDLFRKDTLRPGDSISVYNVPAPAPRATAGYAGGGGASNRNTAYADDDGYETYTNGPHHRQQSSSSAAAYGYPMANVGAHDFAQPPYDPYTGTGGPMRMDYADDEHDQHRQMKHMSYTVDGDYKSQDGHYYSNDASAPAPPGLFSNQMPMTGAEAEANGGVVGSGKGGFDDGDESSKRGLLGLSKDSLDTQIEKRRRGIGRQRWPIVSWILSVAFVAVFIVGLIKAKQETGQAIQTRPYVNPMIGPSSQFQISFGARFVPCMRNVPAVPTTFELACLNASTKANPTQADACPLWEICGLKDAKSVGQAWRFVTPIFLHAGFVHIIFNLLVQLTLCSQIEKLLGSFYFVIIYIAGGIGGNLLGGNFGLVATPSVGASGSIYTCITVEIIDLIYNWSYEYRAKTRLVTSIIFTIIGLAIGLLPGLDNFAHVGGGIVGLLGGLLFAPAIHATQKHRITVWILRVASLGLLIAYFVSLSLNFYNSDDPTKACTWCRYISCLPVFKQCQNNGLTTTTTTSGSGSSRRDLFLL